MSKIRQEQPTDITATQKVIEPAFGQPQEADVVEALRRNCPEHLSLVAEVEGQIIGHLLFSPVVLESGTMRVVGMGLAPSPRSPATSGAESAPN